VSARGEFIDEFCILEKVLRECFDAADWMNFAETTDVPPFCQHTNRSIDPCAKDDLRKIEDSTLRPVALLVTDRYCISILHTYCMSSLCLKVSRFNESKVGQKERELTPHTRPHDAVLYLYPLHTHSAVAVMKKAEPHRDESGREIPFYEPSVRSDVC
jgi:hypothetical protein